VASATGEWIGEAARRGEVLLLQGQGHRSGASRGHGCVDARIAGYVVPRSAFSLYTYPDPLDPRVVAVDTPRLGDQAGLPGSRGQR